MQHALSVRFQSMSYAVATASDAISAIRAAKRERPDLMIVDIGLPGDDGFEVMQRLKALYEVASTPIIILSARDGVATRPRALEAGAVAYLQKPVRSQELLATVRRVLGPTPTSGDGS